jgi:3-methyladenine DNA glycosylase AlkD
MQVLGVRAAILRKIAKENLHLSKATRRKLVSSPYHEANLLALHILVYLYEENAKKSKSAATSVYKEYLSYFPQITNWDLVDLSCHKIVGPELLNKSKAVLGKWAKSRNMWVRRIAMVSTLHLIKRGQLDDCFELAQMLLRDKHDLMHKATGWMLREAGKIDRKRLNEFLQKHAPHMARVTLRYAIERHSPAQRKKFLKIKPSVL